MLRRQSDSEVSGDRKRRFRSPSWRTILIEPQDEAITLVRRASVRRIVHCVCFQIPQSIIN